MTSRSSATDVDDPGPRVVGSDLSSAFGPAAAASLRRGARTRRNNSPRNAEDPVAGRTEPVAVQPEPPQPATSEDDMQDPTDRRSRTGAPPPARRFRVVPVRDRRQIDMLLLAVAKKRPANGRDFIDLVREGSDGVFLLPEGTVYHELHRLKNDRLIDVVRDGAARRYRLTKLGERVLSTRRRQWAAFSQGFDRVLETNADD